MGVLISDIKFSRLVTIFIVTLPFVFHSQHGVQSPTLQQIGSTQQTNPFPQQPKKSNYGSALQTKTAEKMVQKSSSIKPPDNIIYDKLNSSNYVLNSSSTIPSKSQQSINYVNSLVGEVYKVEKNISSSIPNMNNVNPYFDSAFNEIKDMLDGKTELSLKRAVFLTENAWFEGQMDYNIYSKQIEEDIRLIERKMINDKMPLNDNLSLSYMAHKFMKDTLVIDYVEKEQRVTTMPKSYDFNDAFGLDDVSNMFVSKLMVKNSGQCKSMPLYYLILMESLGGNAYLSFSPGHTYIKCKNARGELFNIELTNGMLTSDSWVLGSGFVKAEAVKSGIFLDTLNKKEVIANCLVDLARYYKWRYGKNDIQQGYDNFNLKCINETLKVDSNNIHALLEKSNYYSVLLNYVAGQYRYKTTDQIIQNPKTKRIFIQRNKLYALTDGLGYEPIPQEAYSNWLNSINDDMQKKEHKKQSSVFSKITTPIK